jgi:saccharopine dehydrogenase-like NADP-dependent oxidoreductase
MKIVVIGAEGLAGTSLMSLLAAHRPDIQVVAYDSDPESEPPVRCEEIKLENLGAMLRTERPDAMIDLAPEMDKEQSLKICDDHDVSVINATLCDGGLEATALRRYLDPKLSLATRKWRRPHLMGCGANPGTVNALVAMMVERAGRPPVDVTLWEMDSTLPFKWNGEGFSTWSPKELASEWGDESTWEVVGQNLKWPGGPPIDNLRTVAMPDGTTITGVLCQHEEVLRLGYRFNCPVRYVYAFSPDCQAAIIRNLRENYDLPLVRKMPGRVPDGGDKIGAIIDFGGGMVMRGSFEAHNQDAAIPDGSNATSYLVACGLMAAIAMLPSVIQQPRLWWPDEFSSRWVGSLNGLCGVTMD